MPAAAKKARIKASVGAAPRPDSSDGPKVKNAPADIMVVQRLLCAAGQKTDINGRPGASFVKAVSAFQKANGFKYPDGVVDAGGRTFKILVKKASSRKDPNEPIECFTIVIKGRVHPLSEKDFNKAVAEICKKLDRIVVAMKSHYETVDENADFYITAATGAGGFMDALVMWSSSLRAGLSPPSFTKGPAAWGAIMKADKAVKSRDVRKAVAAMPLAQKAINTYAKEVSDYGNKFTGGAQKMQENLELVRDTSFEIASYIAAGYIMARTRVPPHEAKAAAGAFFGMIKSTSTQYGRSVAGYSDSLAESFGVIMFDTVAGGIKGGLNGKYVDDLGTKLATKLVGKPPFKQIGITALQKFFKNWAHGAGKQTVTEAFGAVIDIVKDAGKAYGVKGKNYDWGKEIEKKLTDAVFKIITGGVMKNMEKANKSMGASLGKSARGAATDPALLKKLRLDKNKWFTGLPKSKQMEHFKNVLESLGGNIGNDVLKSSWGGVVSTLSGTETPQAISDAVAKNVIANNSFQKAMLKKFEKLEREAGKGGKKKK